MISIAGTMDDSIEAVQAADILKEEIDKFNVIYCNEFSYDAQKIEDGKSVIEKQAIMLEKLIMKNDEEAASRFKMRHEINKLEMSLCHREKILHSLDKLSVLKFWVDYGCVQDIKKQSEHLLFNLDSDDIKVMELIREGTV